MSANENIEYKYVDLSGVKILTSDSKSAVLPLFHS